MKRNKIRYIFVVILVLAGVIIFFWQKNGKKASKTNSSRKTKSTIKPKQTKQKQIGRDSDHLLGMSDVSSQILRKIYDESEVVNVSFSDFDCLEKIKHQELKYSFIDFVFLKKKNDEGFVPVETGSFKYRNIKINNNKCHAIYPYQTDETGAIIRLVVLKNCRCRRFLFAPDTVYKFTALQHIGKVSHKFRVPSEDELDFVPLDRDKKPEPYRFPILVGEMDRPEQQTDDENRTRPEPVELTVRGLATKKQVPDHTEVDKTQLLYHSKHAIETLNLWNKKEPFTITLTPPDSGKDVMGGDLSLIWKTVYEPPGDAKRELRQLYLLQYKSKVASQTVNLTKTAVFEYQAEKNVRQTIRLTPYDLSEEVLKTDRVVWLKKDLGGHRPADVYAVEPMKKNGEWTALIDLPPGTYQLYFGHDVIENKFEWPPGN